MATIEDNLQAISDVKQSIKQALINQGQTVSDSDSFASYSGKVNNIRDLDGTIVHFEFDSTQRDYSSASSYPARLSWFITTIQNLDITGITNMSMMFANCQHLTTIPAMDTSNVTNMPFMFYNCKALTSIPAMDTSNVTGMSNMFYACESLTSIPLLDTSHISSTQNMFYNCYALTTIPQLNTSNVTSMNNMFYYCRALTSVPAIDTSNVTTMTSMFRKCDSLTSLPTIDTSSVTSMDYTFYECSNLETITITDTSNVTNVSYCFSYCTKLKTINGTLDLNKVTNNSYLNCIFGTNSQAASCPTLLEEVRIKNLGLNLVLQRLTNLSHDSLVYLINNLKTVTNKTLTLGATNLAKLTAEEIAVGTAKGWTIV